jgi:acyl-CoA dehydrogenase
MTLPLNQIQEFVVSELFPLERTFLSEGSFEALVPTLKALRQTVKELGWWAPHMPKELGGMGLGLIDLAQVGEILGQSPVGHYVFGCQAPDAGNMEVLHQFGTSEQKEDYLYPLVDGRIRSCFSMTEPEYAGSNPVNMGTSAVKIDGNYHINGHKWFTTGADGAAFAIVMCVTNPSERKHLRASQIIVPLDTQGVEQVQNISIMGERGSDWFSHSEIRYSDVIVPVSNRIGGEGFGFMIAQKRLGPGRIHHCMRWIGICERALGLLCRRAIRRELDKGIFLADKQTIQNWIADARAGINASRLLVMQAAAKIDSEGSSAARKEISIIKFYVAGVMTKILDRAIQAHGAMGITDETPLSFWYRHERGARIYDGPDEVHRARVARLELKEHR